MPKLQFCTRLLALFCGCTAVAVAQNQPAGDLLGLSLEQLMKVQFYTASKHTQDASDTPASVSIVTREDIRAHGYRTLADVLQSVRGFWVTSDRSFSYLGVRGFARPGDSNTRVLLLVNGHRLNDNVTDSALIGTGFPLDMDLVERIEVVRGPGSSLYGTNALFGVINVITQQPPLAPTVEASAAGATQFTRQGRITIGLPKVMDGALFSASMYRSNGNERLFFPEFDSPATNHGVAEDVDGDRDSSLFALLHWKRFQLQSLVGDHLKIIPAAPGSMIFNDPRNRARNTTGFAELGYKRDFASGLQLTSRWFYDGSHYGGLYAYPVGLAYNDGRADAVGTEAQISRSLGRRNMVTVGTEFRYNLRQEQQNGYNLPRVITFKDNHQSSVFAFYAQDELRVTRHLLVSTGLRVDHYSTYGSTMSPRVAAIFHADHKTAIKYSYGQAFRAPNAYELYNSNRVSQEPNPGLQPERIASQELSIERVLTPAFHVVIEGFYNALSNMLVKHIDDSNGFYHFVNVDTSSGKGLEFELDAQHKGMRGELSYTVQRSTEGHGRAMLADSPEHVAKMDIHVPLPSALLAGLGVQYLSPQVTPSNVRLPDSLTANLTLSTRKPILGFDLSASCYNLLNRHNYAPPSPTMLQTRLLQDGRGFRFQITRAWVRK